MLKPKFICFLVLLGALLASGCAKRVSPLEESLTSQEARALVKARPELTGLVSPEKLGAKAEERSEGVSYEPVEVVEGPNTSLQVKHQRCVSGFILPPFVSSQVTLEELIGYLKTQGVNVQLIEAPKTTVDLGLKVVLHFPEGASLCEVAHEVARQTGLYVQVDEGDTLTISPLVRLSYRLPTPPGDFKVNSSFNVNEGGEGSMTLSASAADQMEFSKAVKEKLDEMLSDKGFYIFDEATGYLTVFAPPSLAGMIDVFIKQFAESVSRAAKIYLTVVQIHDDDTKQHSLDWSFVLRRALIDKPWRYGLTSKYFDWLFSSPKLPEEFQGYSAGTVSVEAPEKHRFLVDLLRRVTKLTVVENTSVNIISGQGAVVSSGRVREYIKELTREKTTYETSEETSYDIKKDEIYSGVKIYLSGTIRQDSISLALLLELQELVDMETVNLEDYMIQNPTTDVRRYATVLQLADRQTSVIVGVVRTKEDGETTGPNFGPLDKFLGNVRKGRGRSYLVILITPEIIKNERGTFHEVLR